MKYVILSVLTLCLVSCQKNIDRNPPSNGAVLFDSLVGNWKYQYDYCLVSTVAEPTVIIDSLWSGDYAPLSYFNIQSDSTYKWWRTEMETEPAIGYGVSGKIYATDPIERNFTWSQLVETQDNFVTQQTLPVCPPRKYTIKILTSNKLVCSFTVTSADGTLRHWYDVYTR
jgi:hypothetical protein